MRQKKESVRQERKNQATELGGERSGEQQVRTVLGLCAVERNRAENAGLLDEEANGARKSASEPPTGCISLALSAITHHTARGLVTGAVEAFAAVGRISEGFECQENSWTLV